MFFILLSFTLWHKFYFLCSLNLLLKVILNIFITMLSLISMVSTQSSYYFVLSKDKTKQKAEFSSRGSSACAKLQPSGPGGRRRGLVGRTKEDLKEKKKRLISHKIFFQCSLLSFSYCCFILPPKDICQLKYWNKQDPDSGIKVDNLKRCD